MKTNKSDKSANAPEPIIRAQANTDLPKTETLRVAVWPILNKERNAILYWMCSYQGKFVDAKYDTASEAFESVARVVADRPTARKEVAA